MKKARKKVKGQETVEEYIIVIIAVMFLIIMGVFRDRIRTIVTGVSVKMGVADVSAATSSGTTDVLKKMTADGFDVGS